jgi:hypothetical protein
MCKLSSPKDIANLKNEIEKRQKETDTPPTNAITDHQETVVVDKADSPTTKEETLASS